MMGTLTYKFRLYPTRTHEQLLTRTLDCCRFTYNQLLEQLNKSAHIDRGAIQHHIVTLKKEHPDLCAAYSKTLQYECVRLFGALRGLTRLKQNGRKVGRLRFKPTHRFKTFTYNQSGYALLHTSTRHDKLHLAKIGDIPLMLHRPIKGAVKQVTVKHCASGKWFAFVTCDDVPSRYQHGTGEVGIDLGLDSLIHDSNNRIVKHPKHLLASHKQLNAAQRRLHRCQKISKNRRKARLRVAKIYEHVVNQRDDFAHKLSHHYATTHTLIAHEDLDLQGLIAKQYNKRTILDAAIGRFVTFLSYKAASAGTIRIPVDPRGTTQKCSSCGRYVHKALWNRMHECPCGFSAARDYNSARLILLRATGREPPDNACQATTATPPMAAQVIAMTQEALPARTG